MTTPNPLPVIQVLGRRGCVGCDATYRTLRKLGIPFIGIDVDQVDGAADRVRELGYSALPVVIVESTDASTGDHWSGFRPDRLRKLIPTVGEAA